MSPRASGLAALLALLAPAPVCAAPPAAAAACLGCHPVTANAVPMVSLARLSVTQIVAAMHEFRRDARAATLMNRLAKGYSDQEVLAIAQWYAGAGHD